LQTFSECQISVFETSESLPKAQPSVNQPVCVCLRSIVNIPLQVGLGILNA